MSTMTDAAVAHAALEYRRLRAVASKAEAEAKVQGDVVIAELRRRKAVEPFVHHGLTITVVAGQRTTYRVEDLRKILSRAVFGRVSKLSIDNTAMKAEIKAGRVSGADVAAAADVKVDAPHIVVSGDVAA
jgi:hypothetical protein